MSALTVIKRERSEGIVTFYALIDLERVLADVTDAHLMPARLEAAEASRA